MRLFRLGSGLGAAVILVVTAVACEAWARSTPFAAPVTPAPLAARIEPAEATAETAVPARERETALRLLRGRDFEAAYRLYMDLLRDYPLDDEVNYGLAYAALGTGRYPHALLAFERLSDRHPDSAALRVRLAETQIRLGDAPAARRELDAARRIDPLAEAAAVERVEQAAQALEKNRSLWTWSGRLGAGFVYDSNANLGPASEYMTLGEWRDLYVEGVKGLASWGRYVSASADAARRADDASPWQAVGDAAVYKRWNGNEDLVADREFGWGRLALGARYAGRRLVVDLRLKGDMADQGNGRHARALGPEFSLLWAAAPRVHLNSRAAWERRDYRQDKAHNGSYWWAGQYVRLLIGSAPHEIVVGGRALRGSPRRAAYEYTGWEGSLSILLRLPWRVELAPSVSYRRDRYRGSATALEAVRRSDSFLRAGAALRRELVPGLQAELSWNVCRAGSSSPLYRYTQHTVGMGLTWTFR